MRVHARALAVGAAVVAMAGCGGDDDDGDGATTAAEVPLTKSEYIAQGDEICAQGTLQITTEGQNRFGDGGQPTADEITQFAEEVVVPAFQNQGDALRNLPPPEGDEKQVEAIYEALQEGTDALADDPSLLQDPDVGGVLDRASRLARQYGFKQCGER